MASDQDESEEMPVTLERQAEIIRGLPAPLSLSPEQIA